jgi:hypothetical protein
VHLRVIEQSPGVDEARGSGHDKCEAAEDESKAAIAPERSRQPFELQSMRHFSGGGACHLEASIEPDLESLCSRETEFNLYAVKTSSKDFSPRFTTLDLLHNPFRASPLSRGRR